MTNGRLADQKYYNNRFTEATETYRKGRNIERAGPHTHVQQLSIWRNISTTKVPY